MFNRSKAWALGLLAAVFAAGIGAGWGLQAWAESHEGARPGGGGRRGPDAMVAYLARELDLTPPQRDSVRAVFSRHRSEMEAIWREVHPRLDSLRAVMNREISAQLAPDQQARYQRLIAELEHRHRMGDSAAGKTEAGGGHR